MDQRPNRPINEGARFLLLTMALLLQCGCGAGSEIVAQVGETAITTQDIAYRQAVVALRSGKEFPAHLALFQLLEEAFMVEVGRAHGVVVTEEMLANEAARVQATSHDPETLMRIRELFGDDESAFRHLVLQPTLINQLLHARFSLGHDIQAEPLARAQELLAAAHADPALLPDLAQDLGGESGQLQIVGGRIHHGDSQESVDDTSEGEGLPPELGRYGVELPDYDREFVEEVVAGLAVGELHPNVIEDRHSFLVVRLLNREGQDTFLECAIIPKLVFASWFQAQSQRHTLSIRDADLRAALLAEVDAPYITDRLQEVEP
jgi:hypothetical protein